MLPIEKQIDFKIRKLCFNIAENVVGYEPNLDALDYLSDLDLLITHAECFYKHTLNEYYAFNNKGFEDTEILLSALKYIENNYAIPPMLNDFTWFGDCLHTLLSFFSDDNILIEKTENDAFLRLLARKLKERYNDGKD